jgi:hypothetical protein
MTGPDGFIANAKDFLDGAEQLPTTEIGEVKEYVRYLLANDKVFKERSG